MAHLPAGTVSLLFSDIEGSTALLSRLGDDYVQALTGQRRVLRSAWASHGGTEMGTEGDSFFVVFPSAPAAAVAAVQAQRELHDYPWSGGEPVRVRMGIHTGSPTIHDGGYVGMDVHRAARIAGAAHGGQVVLSDATAHLVQQSLPEGVVLKDLGAHKLKDLPNRERLFQLADTRLQVKFPPLKSLGTSSSLPVALTPLLGRDGELAELTALLGSPAVRLLTLTGPGGSGKTRLAVELGQRLTAGFPDGVYFVPLAAVSTAVVMWTTIAEVLDVPAEARTPPGFFEHVVHRSALLILDNLEQLPDADAVVAELLTQAPRVILVATSRRPLHLAAERQHAVPPLELPSAQGLDVARSSGAVQLFVQQARAVRSDFSLSAENADDVAACCRRLDGLPLALELAAVRTRVLSPRALLGRLDQGLDMSTGGRVGPQRQRTLRATIGWSYELLTLDQQVLFRRLGVFSGSADLDAIAAVMTAAGNSGAKDTLDLVADLVDASLVTVSEDYAGEPRIGMLETIRSYAGDLLSASAELEAVEEWHATYYLEVAGHLQPLLDGGRRLETRSRFETEHDNLRAALTWALRPDDAAAAGPAGVSVGLRLYKALRSFWDVSGYFAEDERWLGLAIQRAGANDSAELAFCLFIRAANLRYLGQVDRAREHALASVSMWRRLTNAGAGLSRALRILSDIELQRGEPSMARPLIDESLRIAQAADDKGNVRASLSRLASLEAAENNYQRALDLFAIALDIARQLDEPNVVLDLQQGIACTLREMGRAPDARVAMLNLIPQALALEEPAWLMLVAEDYSAILAELGDFRSAAQLLGAAEASRDRLGLPRDPLQEASVSGPIVKTRARLASEEWTDLYQAGRARTVEDSLARLLPVGR